MTDDLNEYRAFEGLIIGRCCRDWPAVMSPLGGTCGVCGQKPKLILETYLGKYHGQPS